MNIINWIKEKRRTTEEKRQAAEKRVTIQRQITTAIKEQKFDLATQLLSSTGDPTVLDWCKNHLLNGKDSPLLAFSFLRNADGVRWLLHQGANPNVSNAEGKTPLHTVACASFCMGAMMCGGNPVEVLCILLEAGADPHVKDANGKTPLDIIRKAPSELGGAAQFASTFDGGTEKSKAATISSIGGNLQAAQLMQSTLEACTNAPTPHDFAATAVLRPTKGKVPFFMVSSVIRAIMDTLRQKYPNTDLSDIVRESMSATAFACPNCGPLNPEMFALAVSAKWVQEMNPGLSPIFAGPNVAATFKGWCPACQSTSVEVSFDPQRLSFVVPAK